MTALKGGVLIVDDEVLIADYLQMLVEDEGFEVTGVTASPEEALTIASSMAPSLALVDVNLVVPGDGLILAAELQGAFATKIILMSGTAEPQARHDGADVAALGFLHKPFLPAELARLLQDAFPKAA